MLLLLDTAPPDNQIPDFSVHTPSFSIQHRNPLRPRPAMLLHLYHDFPCRENSPLPKGAKGRRQWANFKRFAPPSFCHPRAGGDRCRPGAGPRGGPCLRRGDGKIYSLTRQTLVIIGRPLCGHQFNRFRIECIIRFDTATGGFCRRIFLSGKTGALD